MGLNDLLVRFEPPIALGDPDCYYKKKLLLTQIIIMLVQQLVKDNTILEPLKTDAITDENASSRTKVVQIKDKYHRRKT